MSSPEQQKSGPDSNIESGESAHNRLESLGNNLEARPEFSNDQAESRAEKARDEALESAVSVESGSSEKCKQASHSAPVRRGRIGKKQLNNSYKQTISRIQTEMPVSSRLFSKVIHNKAIEGTSEVISNTIARPNAVLSGAIAAFLLTLLAYVVSKNYGYVMSGFETIGAFVIGWTIGLTFDYLRVLLTGKKY